MLPPHLLYTEDGSEVFSFASPYAAGFGAQLVAILRRSHLAHLRDVSYNCGRIGILVILYLLFGVIYLKLDTTDEVRRCRLTSA